ncbi:MAG: hypothetical protein D6677_07580 [Calditrichaeota bacterium]|nr:MAG: hypothetical protein D6677_07580 [Calditrichota bacterium]
MSRIVFILIVWCLGAASFLTAQNIPAVKFDDFDKSRAWWVFHRDGTVARDTAAFQIGKGYMKIRLRNPKKDRECNVGISEAQPLYSKRYPWLAMETRLRLLTPMQPGSRGWGFWKTAKDGRADFLAWFMEQLLPAKSAFTWNRVGVLDRKKVYTHNLAPFDDCWHVYRVERDRRLGTTQFYIDGQRVESPAPFAPGGKMAFHLWIDNQVYSRSRGILRQEWQGESALVVDYVSVVTQKRPTPALLYDQQTLPVTISRGKNALFVCSTLEDLSPYDVPDQVTGRFAGNEVFSFKEPGAGVTMVPVNSPVDKEQTITFRVAGGPVLEALESVSYDSLLYATTSVGKPARDSVIPFTTHTDKITVVAVVAVSENADWGHFKKNTPGGYVTFQLDDGTPLGRVDGNRTFGRPQFLQMTAHLNPGAHHLVVKTAGQAVWYGLWIFGKA